MNGQPGEWCRALTVLRDNCQGCHGAQPLFGAPMPLATIEHLRAKSVTNPSKFVYELVAQRIHDNQKPMPPSSVNDPLTATELAAVDAWIASGAAGGNDPTCSSLPGTGGAGGGNLPPVPTADWPADCEQRYKLTAHGVSKPGDTTKFNVSAGAKEFYQCFFFKAPWGTDEVQALQFRPVIDDARVLHHWLFYGSESAMGADGQVGGNGCSNGALLAGWAPGGQQLTLPPDVGLQTPKGANATVALELHYNNLAGLKDALDASGVEFCTTKKFRTHTAAVHWLGSNSIFMLPHQKADVVATCDPASTQPVRIMGVSPHMHQLGVHAKLILNRKDGTKVSLHDKLFAFADQRHYPLDIVVNDGDTLTTTCTYNNTTNGIVTFGPKTENEMCYNFVTAYPAGGLSGGLFSQGNHCLQ